jgi:heme/copper-type cytochrome/quinol oxidase subunit 2
MKKLLWILKDKKLLVVIGFLLLSAVSFAQNNQSNTDELMRSNGKIYVVVAVCLTILTGLFIYVFLIDRKISKLEKEN